jgi:hypothetical protein
VPCLLRRPKQRRALLRLSARVGVGLLAAPLAGCDETPALTLAAWQGPASMADPRLRVLSWALLAPSPHNSQPWRAELAGADRVLLRADSPRLLPVVDPDGRQAAIAMGAFIELLALAGRAQGDRVEIAPRSDGGADGPSAEIRLTAQGGLTADPLFAALPRRRSSRLAYDPEKPVAPEHVRLLSRASAAAGVTTGFAVEPARVVALRELTLAAFESEYGLPAALGETVGWLRLGAAEVAAQPDGIALTGTQVWWLRRTGLLSRARLARPGSLAWQVGLLQWRNLIAGTASFGWLVTADDNTASRIAAGRAYMRLDLAAALAGMAIHPVSQVLGDQLAMAGLRRRLDALLGIRAPARVQMLFRLGYAGPQSASPRLPLSAILAISR